MKTIYGRFIIAVLAMSALKGQAQIVSSDSIMIHVHFLHGSKPKHQFRHEEQRWFGGVLGGHAGVEYAPGEIVNFLPDSRFHVLTQRRFINSRFSIHDTIPFYEILGGEYSSVKKTIVSIPLSARQKARLDSVVVAYRQQSPYDYAFFGMRCGAAAYDLLAQAGLLKTYSFAGTWSRLFYPRKTRRRLERLAKQQGYRVQKMSGSTKRIWEKD